MIRFNDFESRYRRHRAEIERAVKRVLRSGWFILGKELEQFEHEFARYLGVKHVVGVNSGTDALFIALRAIGVGQGDEVITVANTATPTVSAIRMTGAAPVFVDVDERTHNLNPALLNQAFTRRTRAVLPVHLFGYPAEIDEIAAIAAKRRVKMIEDAAQATGAVFRRRRIGTFGHLAAFSFYPTKTLGAFGDGGAIATDDDSLAEAARQLRNYGEQSKYNNVSEGVNSRLDELQAAILRWGLPKLDGWNRTRRKLAALYRRKLTGLPLGLPPADDATHRSAWHLFVVRSSRRDDLRNYLSAKGVQTAVHYPAPIYKQPAYKFLKYTDRDLPVTAKVMSEILSLPLNPEMSEAGVVKVCQHVREYHGGPR